MTPTDREFMRQAVEAARKSRGGPTDPRVGAIAVRGKQILGTAHRGEIKHAEYVLLAEHMERESLAGATIYTTLEPCTVRNPPKVPCVERLIKRRVGRVVIGMLDPNPLVSGFGYRRLREAGVRVALTDDETLLRRLEELNAEFIQAIEVSMVHNAAKEIVRLGTRPTTPRQKQAAGAALRNCLDSLVRINRGEIRISGREGGYFERWIERLNEYPERQHVRAFIRLSAFEPEEVSGRSWFEGFYRAVTKSVEEGLLTIDYVFLLRSAPPGGAVEHFIKRFETFANRIACVHHNDPRLTSSDSRPSIVLFDTQRIAFTHDRGDDGTLIEATEWTTDDDYRRLSAQFTRIEIVSSTHFVRSGPR